MTKSMIGGARRRVPAPVVAFLFVFTVALFLGVVARSIAQQCDAVEIASCSESDLKSEEADSAFELDEEPESASSFTEGQGVQNFTLPTDAEGELVETDLRVEEEEEFEEFEETEELNEEGLELEDDDEDDGDDGADDEEEGEEEEGEDEEEDDNDFEGEDFEDPSVDDEEELEAEEPDENSFDETDVVVLGVANFSAFVNLNNYVLAEFYAPWCGHCQRLAPDYAEAATLLKGLASLAKVDITANDELAREYSVESYPTIFLFIDGVYKKYTGHTRRDDIVDYIKQKTSLTVARLLSKDDAELTLESQKSPMSIALLSSLEGEEVEEFTSAARQHEDVLFYLTNSADVAEVFDIPNDIERPALVLLKQEIEKVSWFDGPFKRGAISTFVNKHKLPLIVTLSNETTSLIHDSHIKKQVLLFAGLDDFNKLKSDFMEASKALMGKLIFVHVDLDDTKTAPEVAQYFDLKGDGPVVMGFDKKDTPTKFLLEGNITADNVKAFGEALLADSLKAYRKSEAIPETNDEDVKTVVGLNLDDIVLDESKDAFLEIYSPTCQYCEMLEPVWEKLAKRLKGVDSIVIAKMNGMANEHDRAPPNGFPTLLFYPAGKKSFDPISFDDENRTVKNFVKFLKKEAAIPFTVPKKPESSTIEFSSSTTSTEPTSSPESTAQAIEAPFESVNQDQSDFGKDEL